jgi:hypothetical protein
MAGVGRDEGTLGVARACFLTYPTYLPTPRHPSHPHHAKRPLAYSELYAARVSWIKVPSERRGLDERVLGLAGNESVRTGGGVDGTEFDLLSK